MFDQAIIVAGLPVSIVSACLLLWGHGHSHVTTTLYIFYMALRRLKITLKSYLIFRRNKFYPLNKKFRKEPLFLYPRLYEISSNELSVVSNSRLTKNLTLTILLLPYSCIFRLKNTATPVRFNKKNGIFITPSKLT